VGYGDVGFGNRRFAIDVDYATHVDYCHIDPVKHGYVQRASEWPHSTFHRHVERGVYPLNWATGPDIDWTVGERA
jgi:putative transposase